MRAKNDFAGTIIHLRSHTEPALRNAINPAISR
jgi:hypothetical protein